MSKHKKPVKDRIKTTVHEIYEDTFQDQSCIINFIRMLKGKSFIITYSIDESSTPDTTKSSSQKKIQMLLFKILNLCCASSVRICSTILVNGFIDVVISWMGSNTKATTAKLDKAFHNEGSEPSDLEEFKIGSGGAATTSFHMTRKNSNAKISDITDSEDSINQREILNLLHTLLSIDVSKEDTDCTPEQLDCKKVLTGKNLYQEEN